MLPIVAGGGTTTRRTRVPTSEHPTFSLIILDSCCRAETIGYFQRYDSFHKQRLPSYKGYGVARRPSSTGVSKFTGLRNTLQRQRDHRTALRSIQKKTVTIRTHETSRSITGEVSKLCLNSRRIVYGLGFAIICAVGRRTYSG